MNTENPNDSEAAIENVVKLWDKLKVLMEGNHETKYEGVLPSFLRGKALTREQLSIFESTVRDIGYDLSGLARSPKHVGPWADGNITYIGIDVAVDNMTLDLAKQEMAKAVSERELIAVKKLLRGGDGWSTSSMQTFVDDAVARIVLEYGIDQTALDCAKEYKVDFNEIERAYRHDYNTVKIPEVVARYFEGRDDFTLEEWLVDKIQNSNEVYELFDDIETVDSETIELTIDVEERA